MWGCGGETMKEPCGSGPGALVVSPPPVVPPACASAGAVPDLGLGVPLGWG